MYKKDDLPEKFRPLYFQMKAILADDAFIVWCENLINDERNPMPENHLRNPNKAEAFREKIQQARDAVSGYSENNGARKAVEILAEAIESKL
jgi:hypothetical protein